MIRNTELCRDELRLAAKQLAACMEQQVLTQRLARDVQQILLNVSVAVRRLGEARKTPKWFKYRWLAGAFFDLKPDVDPDRATKSDDFENTYESVRLTVEDLYQGIIHSKIFELGTHRGAVQRVLFTSPKYCKLHRRLLVVSLGEIVKLLEDVANLAAEDGSEDPVVFVEFNSPA